MNRMCGCWIDCNLCTTSPLSSEVQAGFVHRAAAGKNIEQSLSGQALNAHVSVPLLACRVQISAFLFASQTVPRCFICRATAQAESAGSLEKEVYHLQRELLQERTKARAARFRLAFRQVACSLFLAGARDAGNGK